ncbi:MAG: hypothetical protein IT355_03910 [Gemmatimonadaceae bacterium]|nr:hypothetical protein [Gemmatimonadaceae bacterium]
MRVGAFRAAACLALSAASMAGCGERPRTTGGPDTIAAARVDSAAGPDSIPEERPDTIRVQPPDSATISLGLLPAPSDPEVGGESGSLGERAVFAPRSQRWFMARPVDSVLAMDIGRIDGGVGTTDAARAAFDRMVVALSPVQAGMTFTLHASAGPAATRVTGFRLSGRRIVALLDAPFPAAPPTALPIEWRGNPAMPLAAGTPRRCDPGDGAAIESAVARYAPADSEALSVLRGCFGKFRAMIAIRPRSITPETVERVVLVRADGTTRSGKLRDLSYPLHELLATLDLDRDGTDEIVVHSFRPAMETWAALRMTDSVTFTRFASGFTIEKR